MMGQSIERTNDNRGIIPRICNTIYEKINSASDNFEYEVRVSFIEIYREKIRDLLNPSKDNLQIRQNSEKGVYIDDVTEKEVDSENQIYDVLETGNGARAVTKTDMND
jgi:kinesin family protein 5